MSVKRFRQAAILDLVAHGTVRSQAELRRLLRARGIVATQATLSRDVRDLGLVKHAGDGAYLRTGVVAPADDGGDALHRAASGYLRHVDRVQQLVVLRTDAGQAQALAVAIDRSGSAEVVGTIAGDDTILVITRDARRAAAFARRLELWART
jgi:transcriptional regulator of arginine metabolism